MINPIGNNVCSSDQGHLFRVTVFQSDRLGIGEKRRAKCLMLKIECTMNEFLLQALSQFIFSICCGSMLICKKVDYFDRFGINCAILN